MLMHKDRSHLFILKVGGKKPIQLTSGSANYTSPSWFPDGEKIALSFDLLWELKCFSGMVSREIGLPIVPVKKDFLTLIIGLIPGPAGQI